MKDKEPRLDLFKRDLAKHDFSGGGHMNSPFIASHAAKHHISTDEMITEAKQYFNSFSKGDADNLRSLYAKSVDYFNSLDETWMTFKMTTEFLQNSAYFTRLYKSPVTPLSLDAEADLLEDDPKKLKTTMLLKYFFSDTDIIYMYNSDKGFGSNALKDVGDMISKQARLDRFQFMSMCSYKSNSDSDGRRKTNFRRGYYVLLESDSLPLNVQKQMMFDLISEGLPIKSITFSGSKSIHALLRIPVQHTPEAYRDYCEKVLKEFNMLGIKTSNNKLIFDEANKDGARIARFPNGRRLSKEGDDKPLQELLWIDGREMTEKEISSCPDTYEMVKKYVRERDSVPSRTLREGKFQKYPTDLHSALGYKFYLDCVVDRTKVADWFRNNGKIMIKYVNSDSLDIWAPRNKNEEIADLQKYILPEIYDMVLQAKRQYAATENDKGMMKEAMHLTLDDFELRKKKITSFQTPYDFRNDTATDSFYNECSPGAIRYMFDNDLFQHVDRCPPAYDWALNNIASPSAKKWLVNHIRSHFHLYMNNFDKADTEWFDTAHPWAIDYKQPDPDPNGKSTIQTAPFFIGSQGTGKTTLTKYIGLALSKKGAQTISTKNLTDRFNDFYTFGAICCNEASKSQDEQKNISEYLKLFTDDIQTVEMKFKNRDVMFSGAYKSLAGNYSNFGNLFIDLDDRRYSYIYGGRSIKTKYSPWRESDFKDQLYDFINWILSFPPGYDEDDPNAEIGYAKAEVPLDNERKTFDQYKSLDQYSKIVINFLYNLALDVNSRPKQIMNLYKMVKIFAKDTGFDLSNKKEDYFVGAVNNIFGMKAHIDTTFHKPFTKDDKMKYEDYYYHEELIRNDIGNIYFDMSLFDFDWIRYKFGFLFGEDTPEKREIEKNRINVEDDKVPEDLLKREDYVVLSHMKPCKINEALAKDAKRFDLFDD